MICQSGKRLGYTPLNSHLWQFVKPCYQSFQLHQSSIAESSIVASSTDNQRLAWNYGG
jgi:hypothetical protein